MVIVEYKLRRQTMARDTEWSDPYQFQYEPGNLESWKWPRIVAKMIAKEHRIGRVADIGIDVYEKKTEVGLLTRFQIWAETPKKTTEMDIIICE